jgi:hypothetical protein
VRSAPTKTPVTPTSIPAKTIATPIQTTCIGGTYPLRIARDKQNVVSPCFALFQSSQHSYRRRARARSTALPPLNTPARATVILRRRRESVAAALTVVQREEPQAKRGWVERDLHNEIVAEMRRYGADPT